MNGPKRTVQTAWTAALVLIGGFAVVQYASKALLWFLPYHHAGLINDTVLLLLGLGIGAVLAVLLRRRPAASPPPWRAGLSGGLVLYAAASMAALGWSSDTGIAFGAHRYALFSTPGCEFVARFAGPPNTGRLRGDVFEKIGAAAPNAGNVAVYANLDTLTAFRADCLPIGHQDSGDGAALAATAARQWAVRIGIDVASEALERGKDGAVFRLRGSVKGSVLPDSAGGIGRTLAAIDSHVGERSIMTVYVFQPGGDALSAEAMGFLRDVRSR